MDSIHIPKGMIYLSDEYWAPCLVFIYTLLPFFFLVGLSGHCIFILCICTLNTNQFSLQIKIRSTGYIEYVIIKSYASLGYKCHCQNDIVVKLPLMVKSISCFFILDPTSFTPAKEVSSR